MSDHYDLWEGCEALDVMRATLTREEYLGFLKGNILKYRLRAGHKEGETPERDLTKERKYRRLLEEEQSHGLSGVA